MNVIHIGFLAKQSNLFFIGFALAESHSGVIAIVVNDPCFSNSVLSGADVYLLSNIVY
jgi:hypothetical protein